ncbi:MAG: hypothetical protein HWE18_12145 [Gammaproteobacteria bacterium]|nr:hypothetical protein [Gammaproteobacteria bacterium]
MRNRNITCVCLVVLCVGLSVAWWKSEYQASPTTLKLHELKTDIKRDPVPVTGKVKGLQPPKLGEHQHPH